MDFVSYTLVKQGKKYRKRESQSPWPLVGKSSVISIVILAMTRYHPAPQLPDL